MLLILEVLRYFSFVLFINTYIALIIEVLLRRGLELFRFVAVSVYDCLGFGFPVCGRFDQKPNPLPYIANNVVAGDLATQGPTKHEECT